MVGQKEAESAYDIPGPQPSQGMWQNAYFSDS